MIWVFLDSLFVRLLKTCMNDLSEVIETQALVFMLQWSHHCSSQAPPTFPQPTERIKQLIYIYSWQRGLVFWIKANTLGWWSGDKREAAAHSPFKLNFSHIHKNWAYLDTSLKVAIRSAKSYITSTVSASQGTHKGFRQSWVFRSSRPQSTEVLWCVSAHYLPALLSQWNFPLAEL